ncbi:lyase family protein [Actibacterium sp. D379-3]
MTICALESPVFGGLFGDPELAALLDDSAKLRQMITVEAALARAEGQCGVIPADSAQVISELLATVRIDPASLGAGTAGSGVPVIGLVAALRKAVGDAHGGFVHWGATSQDIIDTALVLQLRDVLALIVPRLEALIAALQTASQAQSEQVMAARTRSQIATPITFGLRIAQWAQPLIALAGELPALKAGLLRVQFGGASGANTAVAPNGAGVSAALARELGLADSPAWHVDRSGIAGLSAWCARLCAALAKMAQDLVLMGRSESDEVRAGAGGGSSTMPQKANPVQSEAIVTLAGFVATLQPGMVLAAAPAEERDGARWSLEWLILPQILVATGAALNHARSIAGTIEANPDNMRAALALGNGSVMSEAATFALTAHMPRSQAQGIVKQAFATARETGQTLAEVLARVTDAPVNWPEVMRPETAIAPSKAMADRIFAGWSRSAPQG